MPPGGLERRSLSGSFSQEASLAGQRHHGRRHRDLGGGLEGLVGGVPTSCSGCQRLSLAMSRHVGSVHVLWRRISLCFILHWHCLQSCLGHIGPFSLGESTNKLVYMKEEHYWQVI